MEKLISTSRRRKSSADHDSVLASTQSDRARLIYSAAFRRLQQKAQVFSLESNSAVRSRLTHSIEVSHIGRYIVATIHEKIKQNNNIDDNIKAFWLDNSLAISNVVESACLMHDIGNPPFGHFGESAIVKWSESDLVKDALRQSLGKHISEDICGNILSDFIHFDGNPQGLRIITNLQGDDGYFGLNLTHTQLASFIKYTYCPDDIDINKPFSKKIGYFSTEKNIMEDVWKNLGMKNNSRHPLGFLMEASDDISYCISDIEDGIEKEIITVEHFSDFTCERIKKLKNKYDNYSEQCDKLISCLTNNNSPVGNFMLFKTTLSNFLVDRVADIFIKDYKLLLEQGRDKEIIEKGTFEYDILDILKDYTSNHLFTSPEAECMELSGFAIISGILNDYVSLIRLPKDKFFLFLLKDNKGIRGSNLHIEKRLFNRLPVKHLRSYLTAIAESPFNKFDINDESFKDKYDSVSDEHEMKLRIHLIIDFISGMTDPFSMETFQMLKGIRVK